ncbi:hypothetical protein BGW42_000331 [Actinomortierella wolfii]|nr:hypothetical protein BGW42_000331 [Actinomortierella wolfii]
MSPISSSSASPSPKPMLKRKPLVDDEVHASVAYSGLPSAAAVAAYAAADVLENLGDSDYHTSTSSHNRHRSLSQPQQYLYHQQQSSLYTSQHQRQSSCSSIISSSSPSPMMMRRQRVPSNRAQTPPRQRQMSGSSTCSSSSFGAWPLSFSASTPSSTCPSLIPSAAPSPMASSSSFDLPAGQRKRSRTISHLDRALKEETLQQQLNHLQLPPTPRLGSRSPSIEASVVSSTSEEDEAKTPPPSSSLSCDIPARRSTLDDLVYAISLDEDLTASVKQAMATFDKISSSLPQVKPDSGSSSTATASSTAATPTLNKPTASSTHRRRMTMGCPGENDPHAIRVVYFTPGCVDEHLAKARAH